MDDKFNVEPEKMSNENYKAWLAYREKGRNSIVGLIGFLGFLSIVGSTIIVLAWRPWGA